MNMYNGLSDQAISLIKGGLKRARTDRAYSVYTIHVLLEAYNSEYSDFLEKVTGVSKDNMDKVYDDLLDSGRIETDKTGEISLIEMEDYHNELVVVIRACEEIAMTTKAKVSAITFLRLILSGKTYAKSALKEFGVSSNRLNQLKPIEAMHPIFRSCVSNLNMKMLTRSDDLVIVNRDKELDKVIETMGRKNKRNPLLIGESGVGKTAIVELLASRIANDEDVPDYIAGKIVLEVDISSIVGGSQYRGSFEAKFNMLFEAAEIEEDVILFFDEFHTLLRAGGGNSDNDLTAANIMKPVLARQFLPIIGATTTKEYNKHIEGDEAFSRRFETIMVNEPSDEDTIKIVNGSIKSYERFHNAVVTPDIVEYAVKLTSRYMTNKKQPDKTFTVIDQACAHQKMVVNNSSEIICLTKEDIRDTVARITDIEIGDLTLNEFAKLKNLDDKLKESVIGQDDAVKAVSDAIRRNKVGLSAHDKPIGTFLFVGPTGVGKTELCKRLSDEFSGSRNSLVRIDMSEYMEKHSVSRLIGSPPGYVGHENGGQLTDAVRRNPYSVILFDEIEKAHKDVFNILLQILDDGRLTDSQGRMVDFCNTIIIMTSNAGYGISQGCKPLGFGADTETQKISEEQAAKALQDTFRPEFLNRLDKIVVFNSLSKDDCKKIVGIMLNQLSSRCSETGFYVGFDESVVDNAIENGFDEKYGARNLKRYLQNLIECKLADSLVSGDIEMGKHYSVAYCDGEIVLTKLTSQMTNTVSIDKAIDMMMTSVKPVDVSKS